MDVPNLHWTQQPDVAIPESLWRDDPIQAKEYRYMSYKKMSSKGIIDRLLARETQRKEQDKAILLALADPTKKAEFDAHLAARAAAKKAFYANLVEEMRKQKEFEDKTKKVVV